MEKNAAIEEENREALRQLESVNMMTKYQIIVTKLETTVNNISRTSEARKILRKKRAFDKWTSWNRVMRQKTADKRKLVYMHFQNKLAAMAAAVERYTVLKSMHGCFA